MSNTQNAQNNTDNAAFLLAQRAEVYGDRIENMVRTAQMWSGFLGHEIQAWQVPAMMAIYKMYRLGITPDYSDNIDDVDGWMLMFREVMGDDLIQARTVEEFLTKKHGPATRVPNENEVEEDFSPSGDEAFRDTLHDMQFPADTAASEGAAIDEFTTRRLQKEAEQSRYFHPYHKLNNETSDDDNN